MPDDSRYIVALSVVIITTTVAGFADSIACLVAFFVYDMSMLDYLTSPLGITLTALWIGPLVLFYLVPIRWWSGRS